MDLDLRQASLLLFAIAFAFNVPAQVSEPASQITGRVVRTDTGAPVKGAAIRLMPPIMPGNGQFQTAITDSKATTLSPRSGTALTRSASPPLASSRRSSIGMGRFRGFLFFLVHCSEVRCVPDDTRLMPWSYQMF